MCQKHPNPTPSENTYRNTNSMQEFIKNHKILAPTLATIIAIGIVAGYIFLLGGKNNLPGLHNINHGGKGEAQEHLDALTVRPNDNVPAPYNRLEQFGPAWTDDNSAELGHNKCDTRNDILQRDLKNVVYQDGSKKGSFNANTMGSNKCKVQSGDLDDPYTGKLIRFHYGRATSSAVQIDHIVALGNVWVSSGYTMDPQQRVAIANDPDNLLAVDGPENNLKRDKDASQWLVPNNPKFRCEYAEKQINVKYKYALTITEPERNALQEQLNRC